eukprot:4739260-Prymnesium_polylepis.1
MGCVIAASARNDGGLDACDAGGLEWDAARARASAHVREQRSPTTAHAVHLEAAAVRPVAALVLALALGDDDPHSWLLRARCHLAMGSVAPARHAYASARRRGLRDAEEEARMLEALVAGWFDHPARLAILFPMPVARRAATLAGRHDGDYSAAAGVSVAWTIFSTSSAARGAVVYFHGNGETADDLQLLAPSFDVLGVVLMVVEYRGYGRSPQASPPLLSTLLTDAEPLVLGD